MTTIYVKIPIEVLYSMLHSNEKLLHTLEVIAYQLRLTGCDNNVMEERFQSYSRYIPMRSCCMLWKSKHIIEI